MDLPTGSARGRVISARTMRQSCHMGPYRSTARLITALIALYSGRWHRRSSIPTGSPFQVLQGASTGLQGGRKEQNQINCAPFCKHRVAALPREEEEQRRDMPRRGLPAVAPQLEAHTPKEAEPGGASTVCPTCGEKMPLGYLSRTLFAKHS